MDAFKAEQSGCYGGEVEVSGWMFDGQPLVTIKQHGASMHFQFNMTPEQAREMSGLLIHAAEKVEHSEVPA